MKPSSELKNFMLNWYKQSDSADIVSVAETAFAQTGEALIIGSAPDELILGYANIIAMYKQLQEAGFKVLVTPGDLKAYSEGTVGWVSDTPTYSFSDGKTVRFRMTSVFHKEGDSWKVLQVHLSVGVPDEALIGD